MNSLVQIRLPNDFLLALGLLFSASLPALLPFAEGYFGTMWLPLPAQMVGAILAFFMLGLVIARLLHSVKDKGARRQFLANEFSSSGAPRVLLSDLLLKPLNLRSIKIVVLICWLGSLLACDTRKPPIPGEVAGQYIGHYGDVVEVMKIDSGGTFDQKISWPGNSVVGHGKWTVDGLGLAFTNIYTAFDIDGKVTIPPELLSNNLAVWVDYKGAKRIAFMIEYGYVLDRSADGDRKP